MTLCKVGSSPRFRCHGLRAEALKLNRTVAVSMAFGPAAGLEIVEALTSEPSLQGCHLLPSVRGDLLAKLSRFEEARQAFEQAAALTQNERERTLLRQRAAACADPSQTGSP